MLTFNEQEARIAEAVFERMFPTDRLGPGATEIGVLAYVDRALAGAYSDLIEPYRLGLTALDQAARDRWGAGFVDCAPDRQDLLLAALEHGSLPHLRTPPSALFFDLLRAHLQEGLFADPLYGGNRDKLGWKTLGHPGVWLENSAEENLSAEPVTKGGVIQSLSDVMPALTELTRSVPSPAFDRQRGTAPPADHADVVLVGVGAVGGLLAPILTEAGLRVVGFEAGPWRSASDFTPDELGQAYYCRATMGPKFQAEAPRWRPTENDPTQPAAFSLGRMMNSVGGSVIHYGAWLRRFHPHHFAYRTHLRDHWGESVFPDGCTVADWPVTYEELEPHYAAIEQLAGVAGEPGSQARFAPRSTPPPMPPLRPFRLGEVFQEATRAMGLHPEMVPVGMNSVPYDGRPATTYTAWSNGFGSFNGAKWQPGHVSVPRALATGNFDLRTHCRVLRITTSESGRVTGVDYLDPNGIRRHQPATTVILCSYTFENVRLLLLSGDAKHPRGLGNNQGQVGRHFMTKMFAHVGGYFPEIIFNRHTGPAAQGVVIDDYLSSSFESVKEGFVGGATLGAENQFLPIQISRESLPGDVPRWGSGYKAHLLDWQHLGVVRMQPDALPYVDNYLDLDPNHRDRSGVGLPVIRATYALHPNEQKLAAWFAAKSAEILRAMGATKTWPGPRFTGVGSSHDLGGCRMSDDPAAGVVNRDLQVHDTTGLYVFGGAVFPTCPGINPTLTIWALCHWAAERMITKLRAERL